MLTKEAAVEGSSRKPPDVAVLQQRLDRIGGAEWELVRLQGILKSIQILCSADPFSKQTDANDALTTLVDVAREQADKIWTAVYLDDGLDENDE